MSISVKYIEALTGTAPCDTCGHYMKCKEKEIACRDFGLYVKYGPDIRKAAVRVRQQQRALEARIASGVQYKNPRRAVAVLKSDADALECFGFANRKPDDAMFVRIFRDE